MTELPTGPGNYRDPNTEEGIVEPPDPTFSTWAQEAEAEGSDEGDLHYNGKVDPAMNILLGPGQDGRYWKVTSAIYNPELDMTTVHVEQYLPNDDENLESQRF